METKVTTGAAPLGVLRSAEIELMAASKVKDLLENPNDRTLLQEIARTGSSAQTSVSGELGQVGKTSHSAHTSRSNLDRQVMRDLAALTETLRELDPQQVAHMNWWRRLIAKLLPTYQPVLDAVARITDNIGQYEATIEGLANELERSCDAMDADLVRSVELQQQIESALTNVAEAAYFGQVVITKLSEASESQPPLTNRTAEVVLEAMNLLRARLAHLNELRVVSLQGVTELRMTERIDRQLLEAVRRAIEILPNIFRIALMVQQSVLRQQSVGAQLDALSALGGQTLRQTSATLLDRATTEPEHKYANGLIALDDIQAAYDNVMAALSVEENRRDDQEDQLQRRMTDLDDLASQLDAMGTLNVL